MNLREDEAAKAAVFCDFLWRAGLLTEACVSFPVLSALAEVFQLRVVADAHASSQTQDSHWAALQHMPWPGKS